MKPWLKALMWLGLGTGLGFSAGFLFGKKQGYEDGRNYESWREEEVKRIREEDEAAAKEEADKAMNEYAGGYSYGNLQTIEGLEEILGPELEDEPEMPQEQDIQIDPDIPQLHPQHLIPEIISEDEFNTNIWQYDLENLIFYEMDEVLFDETTQSIVECPDQVVGVGTLFEFRANPTKEPLDTIYVKNDTFGTLFRIDRLDAAFCDVVDGTAAPTDEDEPEDKQEQDDFWEDV